MKVLVACEVSGTVASAFRATGHEAYSCDLLEADHPYHIVGCAKKVVLSNDWDLVIAHPPCDYLCSSGLHWNYRVPGRWQKTEEALEFFRFFLNLEHVKHTAVENPVGVVSTLIRPPDQYIQPYQFGEDASKKTGLWLKNLPLLKHTQLVEPRIVNGKKRWANQTDSGQNRLTPSPDRAKLRAKTYEGIANAMALQWGNL